MFNNTLFFFQIKDFEQSHDFQTYLERLKRRKAGDEIQEADGLLDGKHGAKGMIIFSPDLNRVEQATIAKLPNFRGAFLAVGDAYDDCEVNIFGTIKLQGTWLIITNRLQTFGIRFMIILHLI